MAFRLSGRIYWGFWFFLLFLATHSHAEMPLPTGSNIYSCLSTGIPEFNADPSQAKPIGVGDVAFADLALRIGLDSFSAPVDIYMAIHAPAVFPDLFLFRSDGSLAPLSIGLSPWKAGTTGPVSEGLLGTIPMSLIPSGDYAFYLLAAPAGTQPTSIFANCYLWVTSVGNLRVLDVSEKASSLFGGDVQGAAAILMALGREYSLENVAKSVLAGTLTEYGEIFAVATAKQTLASGMPSFCIPELSLEECKEVVAEHLTYVAIQLKEEPSNLSFNEFLTAYILYLAHLGYSRSQIEEAIQSMFVGGATFIRPWSSHPDCPFGGIMKKCFDGSCEYWVEPEIDRSEMPAVFSDLDPKDFDIPSTEGMTFPAYYKGTGTARVYYAHPSRGSIECTLQNVVFVAKVGGTGIWEGRLEVHSAVYPSYPSTGPLECATGLPTNPNQPWRVARGGYTAAGTYYEIFDTDTYSGVSDVKFNKWLLWGSVTGTDTRAVYGDKQIIEKEWHFELDNTTEEAYKAAIPPPDPRP